MVPTIQLASGRQLSLTHIDMKPTYAGLLTGKPDPSIDAAVHQALVQDVQRMIAFYHAHPPSHIVTQPKCPLPKIQCIGVFESTALTDEGDMSWAVIGWYQKNFSAPDPEELKDVPWESFAADGNF